MRHRERPIFGLQFHPESVLTEGGLTLLSNFLAARGFRDAPFRATMLCTLPLAPAAFGAFILADSGMAIGDIDLFEVNEAFASVVMRFMQAFDVDHGKLNVNGGAIAMGHPLGATGAMILGTLLDELERSGQGTGLATLCIGSGMGAATVIERV